MLKLQYEITDNKNRKTNKHHEKNIFIVSIR